MSHGEKFAASVVYKQPSEEELRRLFDWVSWFTPGYGTPMFRAADSCAHVSRETREVIFEIVYANRAIKCAEVLEEMRQSGFRPAMYEELIGFAKKFPDKQLEMPIIAIGSVAHIDGRLQFASLYAYLDNGRGLTSGYFDPAWGVPTRGMGLISAGPELVDMTVHCFLAVHE